MNPLLIGPIFDFGKALLDRFGPEDKAAKAAAEMEMYKLASDGELKQIIAQLEINAREAQHPSIFVAGWRPFFGWMGGLAFAYSTIVQPAIVWYGTAKGWPAPPTLNIDLLWTVVTGMLGIGGMRTWEKARGVAK